MLRPILAIVFGFIFIQSTTAHDPVAEMTDAAVTLMNALDDDQHSQLKFDFDHKLRKDWQFIPMKREGLGLHEMKISQRHLAMALVQSALSHRGFSTSMKIMALEQVLHEMENNSPKRDPAKYHLFIFGDPNGDKPWGWRVEGHHLSISFTLVNDKIVSTPAFFGTNPAEIRSGPQKGLRPLGTEEDLGRALIKNLTVEQKEIATIKGAVPSDVINGPGRAAAALEPVGIAAGKMTKPQQRMLRELVELYVNQLRPELAEEDLKAIDKDGFEKVSFAWCGKIQPGQPHYFRVQGPSFILEYDNTQNGANHAHAVWRNFTGDFGDDLLREHYEKAHGDERVKGK